jgi:hypothetical protein
MRRPEAPLWTSLLSANERRRLDSKIEKESRESLTRAKSSSLSIRNRAILTRAGFFREKRPKLPLTQTCW